ncbi:TlpA family protein disulfide reductase [Mucilaginibacter sp. ZT4R22]|uniref:TlpA family protein disulfide reductase n=1 Tax=Mucilaginibacter pankratovii TaxID=2772110 RepID=A0ABR7X0L7_9SPHI|nr:TlpA disulfide reductase family protein [Mucilaginibacter pankratovii]MBD1367249.1 TlpA family protein disulfide reductase [Mucilaginibacter pankratovii]
MKYYTLLLASLISLNLAAQNKKTLPIIEPAYAVVKGHIDNHTEDMWDYSEVSYLKFETLSVPVDKNGDFVKRFSRPLNELEIFLRQGNGLQLKLKKGDTILVRYDAKDADHTLQVSSPDTLLNAEIKTLTAARAYLVSTSEQQKKLYQKAPDSARYALVNGFFNKEVDILLGGPLTVNTDKYLTDIYFRNVKVMYNLKLLDKYPLFYQKPSDKTKMFSVFNNSETYTQESADWYRNSYEYRNFIFDYVRFQKPFKSWSMASGDKEVPRSIAWKDYYTMLASLQIAEVRDFCITSSIMFSFEYYDFDDASAVYRDFITKVQTPFYADTLKKFYANIQRLKPGTPAPGFTLKDENGKLVSLSEFRGKVVYLDFWGVGCGPCIYDIKNHVPALHEKYKDKNIVFINICVDSDEPEWKASLAKLGLHGVNLIARGWNKNPVCKAYNINGIPHYYIIDAAGKIVDNNSPGPSQSYSLHPKLDALVAKESMLKAK